MKFSGRFTATCGVKPPGAEVRFLDTDKAEFKGLDEKHYKQLSRAIYLDENLRDIAIFEAMVGAGLRFGEVLDLQFGDLVIRERDSRENFSYIILSRTFVCTN
jgi:site-specific recombinase XerC